MTRRVAIIGGGIAGLTTAFELTHPDNKQPCEVTVFQQGWRLGGKGASSRPASGTRIEEHGLHLFMGFYDNAFALMRSCLKEAEKVRGPGEQYKIRDLEDAFEKANFIGLMERPQGRDYQLWHHLFGDDGITPGDGNPDDFRVRDYLERGLGLLRQLWKTATAAEASPQSLQFLAETPKSKSGPDSDSESNSDSKFESRSEELSRRLLEARDATESFALASIAVGAEILDTVKSLIESLPEDLPLPDKLRDMTLTALDGTISWANQKVRSSSAESKDDFFRRIWEVFEIVAACLRGIVVDNLEDDSFDSIDHYDFREWLELHGASKAALGCAVLKGLYDLAFEYEEGDPDRPRFSAASALRGSIRMFLTYHGALFWRMKAGMGEVIFEPLYTVLKHRGVKFQFFHELTEIRADDAHAVCEVVFNQQAQLGPGTAYDPLETLVLEPGVKLNYWPAEPKYEFLDGGRERNADKQFECAWNRVDGEDRHFSVGSEGDFDDVVLAIGLGAIPSVAQDLIRKSERWADMVSRVKTVETHALQLWLREDLLALGWPYDPVALSAYVEPFSTWADMTHLLAVEKWPEDGPKSLAYFCHVAPDADPPSDPGEDHDYPRRRLAATRELAWTFLKGHIGRLWPHAAKIYPADFDASKLFPPSPPTTEPVNSEALAQQYVRVNVNPSDRYVLALPGTLQYRLRPGESGFAHLTLAGDWTRNGLDVGCVEAAVLSGRQAAQAITGFPSDERIHGCRQP